MSHETVLRLTINDGSVVAGAVLLTESSLSLSGQLIAVSDNIADLTRVTTLWLFDNAFTAIPAGVFAMTQLTQLNLSRNRLVEIPPEIGRLDGAYGALCEPQPCSSPGLTSFGQISRNELMAVPREIGWLTALGRLQLDNNALTAVPPELGRLPSLRWLYLMENRLTWLPLELDRLSPTTELYLDNNPFPIDVGAAPGHITDSRDKLPELFAATTALAMIRDPAIVILVALQDLFIPALLLVEILDEAFPNSIRMHAKWELVTAVKHFHQRRGIER